MLISVLVVDLNQVYLIKLGGGELLLTIIAVVIVVLNRIVIFAESHDSLFPLQGHFPACYRASHSFLF